MPGAKWTTEELQVLKDNYKDKWCWEIAEMLGRTEKAVQHIFGILGLKRPEPQIGDVFNRLTIISEPYFKQSGNQNKSYVWVRCSCPAY